MMKTRLQRTELLRAARVPSTPKCSATMCLMVLLAILTFPTKTWAQDPIAKIGDTPYESLQTAFDEAADGSTVTLLDNADLGEYTIDIRADEGERNLTFDLNGFSLTGTSDLLYVRSGVNITIKGGTIGGPSADNPCGFALFNIGGKMNMENLTIGNCRNGIYNEKDGEIPGELTIGSGVHISATERCIENNEGKLTLTALPILSWGEEYCGISLGEGDVINFAGEGVTALPKDFKPIRIWANGEFPRTITNGYADHVKSGSEVIDPAKVFASEDDNISMVLFFGEAVMAYGSIQKVSVTKGDEVKPYLSLKTAFDEAADGSTVTLLDNADLREYTIDITADEGERNLTFDLNGFSLTGTTDLLYVRSGVNITIKGGTIGGPSADNPCEVAILNMGGKVNMENLTIGNCRNGIYNRDDEAILGELTIGSGVHISVTERCIDNYKGKLTLTALPILSGGEEYYGISLGEGKVINFAGEGITALPEGFKPIRIRADGESPRTITNGYADHVKSGSEVIDPAKVFVGEGDNYSMVLFFGEAVMAYGSVQKVSVTKGNEVKQYISLRTAFNEAADGSTVTLLDNADLEMIDIKAGESERNLTFDLNGFSLTGTTDLLYVRSGVNITIKGGTIGGPDADNPCGVAILNMGGKMNMENLTIGNCRNGIYNEKDGEIPGELTIGSGVHISVTERCIDNYEGKLTLTALPILSWGEGGCGISLGEGKVINFAGEGVTALPEGFKPIRIRAFGKLPRTITNGYADHVKNGSEVIDPAKVFVGEGDNYSMILFFGEAVMAYGSIQKVSVTKGDEVKPYLSLKTAFEEAADGSTVTLLDNADLREYTIDITAGEGERNLTFDLKGFSLTGTSNLLYVRSGVNITIKGGTIGGPDADNPCGVALFNIGGKVSMENLTIGNCRTGIYNGDDEAILGELTIGSGVHISVTERCIENYEGKLTLTALPILSWGEEYCGISLGEGIVINFAGEGVTALPKDFKPIRIWANGESPRTITNGYADHVKSGSEVIDPAKVFASGYDNYSMVLFFGEAVMAYGSIQKVSVTKGDEVKPYLSLQTAFEEAADGSTVTLLDNADLREYTIDIRADEGERNLTFDLNGFSLTGTSDLLYVCSGVNITIKGGAMGGPSADNPCENAIRNIGGKVNIENLKISNCRTGIYNGEDWLDDETPVTGELTIGSGVHISAAEICIDIYEGKLTLTALPILSGGEEYYGISLGEGKVINFAGEGVTALPKGFKPIKIWALGELPWVITNGYSTFFKNINPADVFVIYSIYESIVGITFEGGEVTFIEEHDVNGDGKTNIADVVALTNAIIAGTKDLKYDFNGDDQVTADDIITLVDFIAGDYYEDDDDDDDDDDDEGYDDEGYDDE